MNDEKKAPPISTVMLIVLAVGGLVFLVVTWSIGYPMNVADYFLMLIFCSFVVMTTFMTSVKFQSPLVLTETTTYTSFNSRVESIYDEEWNLHLGIVFFGGFNAAKRLLSKGDIEAGKTAHIIVTPDARMIESVASQRFILIRGKEHELNGWESAAFLNRPSVRRALEDEVRTARVFFVMSSQSLHADETPTDVTVLGDLANLLQVQRGEIADSVDLFAEEFLRKLKAIKTFQQSPLEQMASDRKWTKKEEEDK